MYSVGDIPDLSDRHLCAFCRMPMNRRINPRDGSVYPYCDDWCATQENEWWVSILVTGVPRKDPLAHRQWLSVGGDGL